MKSLATAPRSASSAARYRRIVEAAVRLFATAPYASVHMDAVATLAAVAKPTLYRYFPTKEALFVTSLEWALEDLRASLHAARLEPAPVELKLRRLIAMVLDRVRHLAPAIHAIENQNAQWGKESRRILRQGFTKLQGEIGALVRDGQKANEFADVNPDLVSLIVLGGLRMAAHSRTAQGKNLADSMALILLEGLRRPQAPDHRPSRHVPDMAASLGTMA